MPAPRDGTAANALILPEPVAPESVSASAPLEPVSRLRPRVLLVDDEPDLLKALAVRLGRRFSVETAVGGHAGIELLRSIGGSLAVIASDLRMPGMDGAAFLHQARELAPDAVRILLTGQADLETAIRVVNEGYVFRFLTKPCPFPLLTRAIEDAVQQARLVTADRILLQRRLDEMGARLLHADRLASLGTMASAVGREMGDVLAAFQTTVRIVRARVTLGAAPTEEDFEALDHIGEQLAKHVSQLRQPGRFERGEPHSDLTRTATETLSMLWSAGVTRSASVDLVTPDDPIVVRLERVRLEQVLVNLLNNAADAVAEGGQPSPRIRVRLALDAQRQIALCEVEDNGCGIAEDLLPHVFTAYFTTKAPDRGTGLSLFVAKRIVESCGGKIGVRSAEGGGSVFCVELPLAAVAGC